MCDMTSRSEAAKPCSSHSAPASKRAIQNLGTWAEFSFDEAKKDIWGNISVLEGCDGGVEISTTDGSNIRKGFRDYILDGAPSGAMTRKRNGSPVIDKLVGHNANRVAIDYIRSRLNPRSLTMYSGSTANC
ncbi:hypothetical protein ACRALDRAFT_1060655 [Sodiomyces alcalophilus JCM 7366]|uniref:uncharacterized protein n=1 Tax=Sodiomyces alcalophilus JCM 7366 TaxID=591952 RepID=UPI0039B48FED